MVLEAQPGTVVGGEDDEGVFCEVGFAERVHEAADFGIDMLDDVDVGVFRVRIPHVFGNVEGDVGHGVGQIKKEGFFRFRRLFDELDGFVGVSSCNSALVDGKFDDFFVFKERSFPSSEGGLGVVPQDIHSFMAALGFALVVGVVHVVGVRNAVVGIEAVGGGKHFRKVSKVPFAHASGGIPVGREVVGEAVGVGVKAVGGFGEENVFLHAHSRGVAAGEEGGTGGRADGAGDVEGGELAAFLGKLVEVGSVDGLGAVAAEVVVALVVGEDEDDVERCFGGDEEGGEEEGDNEFHEERSGVVRGWSAGL